MIAILGYVDGIDLSNKGLTDVPSDIPANETEVYLQRNKISIVRVNSFVLLTELKTLSLTDNVIDTIEPGAFNGLVNFLSLDLVRNKLTTFLDSSTLSMLSALKYLYLGANPIRVVDTAQLGVLSKLMDLGLNWFPLEKITQFLNLPRLNKINFRGNDMTFSSEMLRKLSGLKIILLGHNKFSSLPELGGVEGQIRVLDLVRNRFLYIPDLTKYTNLMKLDLSGNYITLVTEQSLSHIRGGIVILNGNPVICVSELCWLVSDSWPFEVQLTCPDGTKWIDVDRLVICEGKTASAHKHYTYVGSMSASWFYSDSGPKFPSDYSVVNWFILESNHLPEFEGLGENFASDVSMAKGETRHFKSQFNVVIALYEICT